MISRIHAITLTIITLTFNSTNREQTFGSPVHTYNILDSCPGLDMSALHCLPVQNRQNQSNTIVSDTHVALQTAGRYPATLRSWSWLDRFTSWYSIFKLRSNVVCTSCLPRWLYSSPQVSASVFTKSKTQPCHLPHHGSATNGF
jgi:hypothetical protein